MNYLSEHKTKQAKKLHISKSGLEKGMIISCRYTNKEGVSKEQMLVILNPGYEGKLHALSLSQFGTRKLNSLAEMIGVRVIPKYQSRGLEIPKMVMNASSKRFYGAFLKDAKTEYNDGYRTYFLNKLTTTYVIDYKFDEKVQL